MNRATTTVLQPAGSAATLVGFHQTEVGVTPNDWQVRRLGQVVEFLDGQRRPVKSGDRVKMAGIYPYYGASGIVDYVNDYIFDEDLILLGEDGENILSRNLRFAFRVSGKVWVNNHAHVLRSKSGVEIGYLVEYLESLDYEQYNSGTAQPKLNKQTCFGIPVAVPPLPEQRAIAEALSDVDGLLGALAALIAKKRAIKQAAMQQLLTGKTRLPGFSGEWNNTTLDEVAEIKNGATPSTRIAALWNGTIPWCTPTDITGTAGKYLSKTERYITEAGLTSCAASLLPPGALLLCSRATIGALKIATTKICTNQGFKSLVCRQSISNEFLYYLVLTLKPQIIERAIGSTFLEIGKRDLASIAVTMPREGEQTAIAAVLSDMDAEITALEHRRNKTNQIKRGMMQQLLTGRVRLVKPAVGS